MKRCILLLAFLLGIGGQSLSAQNAGRGIGLGIVLGDPTGIDAKLWISRVNAIDAMLGFGDENFHVDYLWHKFGLFNVRRGRLPLYYGIGAAMHFSRDTALGVRVPVGISYLFPRDPVDIFFEIAPVVYLVTKADLAITAGIGVRFFFD
ncbi:MAG: hypothetical protein ACYC5N_01490 [Endomicrobiales bacterium]